MGAGCQPALGVRLLFTENTVIGHERTANAGSVVDVDEDTAVELIRLRRAVRAPEPIKTRVVSPETESVSRPSPQPASKTRA
jgi:hypothetical protein